MQAHANAGEFHLVSHHLCPYVQRVVIILLEKGIPFVRTDIDLGNKPEWFLRLSPSGKVPLLQVFGKKPLFESSVIAEYLEELLPQHLHPEDPYEKARLRGWMVFASTVLDTIARLYGAVDESDFLKERASLFRHFAALEQELAGTTWFAGETFLMVDAFYAPVLRYFEVLELLPGMDFLELLPKVTAWSKALAARTSVKAAVAPDYHSRLLNFLLGKKSLLAQKLAVQQSIRASVRA